MKKRSLPKHGVALLLTLLVSFFFTTSCKKDLELKTEDTKISAITFDEAKAYVKAKENELPFAPNWAKSQYTITKDNYIVRAPLKDTYGTLYLFKDRKGNIKGSIFRLFADSSQNSSNYTGMIIRYDIEDQQLQGLEIKNGTPIKSISYESPKKTTIDKATENIFERIWCWLSGDVYNGTSCIKTVREHPTSNDEGDSGGSWNSEYFFEKTQDIPTTIIVSQENGYKPPVSWGSGASSGGSSGPISNEEYWDGTGWETPVQLTWDSYYDMPYEGVIWTINNLKNEITGDPIEFYLLTCYKVGSILNLSQFSKLDKSIQIGEYLLTPHYDKNGKLLFYAAFRNQVNGIEYIVRADASANFIKNIDYYTSAANVFYWHGVPTPDQVAVASGDFKTGLVNMWSNAVNSVEWWAYTLTAFAHGYVNIATNVTKQVSLSRKGNIVEFQNTSKNKLSWAEQRPNDITSAINARKSLPNTDVNIGKINEGKVAEYVQTKKDLKGISKEVKKVNSGEFAGDIDVETAHEIIEVKTSLNSISNDLKQFNKYVDPSDADFLNPYNKKVIVYIDKPLGTLSPNDLSKVNDIRAKGVTVVNSLDELGKALK